MCAQLLRPPPGLWLPCPLAVLTLKVGRRMVFSMYRQKAMPRVSCRTHAHLGGERSLNDSELYPCLILHQAATRDLTPSHTLHPPCPHRASDPRSRSTTEAGQQHGPQHGFKQMWSGAPCGAQAGVMVPVTSQHAQNTQLWNLGVGPAQGLAAQCEGQRQASVGARLSCLTAPRAAIGHVGTAGSLALPRSSPQHVY
jgi:hypothetical protein